MSVTNPRRRQHKKSPHIELTPPEVLELWREKHYTSKGYLYHLILAHRKAGWWFRIDSVTQFCKDWEIQRRAFYRAKAALIDEGRLEEEIEGPINLRVPVMSTNTCDMNVTPETSGSQPVTFGSQVVTSGSQPVTFGSHSSPETQSEQEPQNPTDLSLLSYRSTTTDVCVDESSFDEQESLNGEYFSVDRVNREGDRPKVNKAEQQVTPNKTEKDPPSVAILNRAEKIGVKVSDRTLQNAIQRFPNRLSTAIACLEEKRDTVHYPTRYLVAAIEQDWKPESCSTTPPGFGEWFNEARQRGYVIASQMQDSQLLVCTSAGHWMLYDTIRQLSWDELDIRINHPKEPSPAPERQEVS